jgi:dimethylargininase
LKEVGCEVITLPAEPDLPDSVFIEDTAIVLDELAIITRPGAASRRPETKSVAPILEKYRNLASIEAPGTLDGGDVLHIDKTIFVGRSARSNSQGFDQLKSIAEPYGYQVIGVEIRGCLHLKSGVNVIAPDTLLINLEWIDSNLFKKMKLIEVDEGEPHAASALFVADSLIYRASYPRTQERIEKQNIVPRIIDFSEFTKAEGGITCCSLIFT